MCILREATRQIKAQNIMETKFDQKWRMNGEPLRRHQEQKPPHAQKETSFQHPCLSMGLQQ